MHVIGHNGLLDRQRWPMEWGVWPGGSMINRLLGCGLLKPTANFRF